MGLLDTIGKFVGNASGIGPVISAGAGIIGNILGNKSQESANKANLEIAQMNNDFNEKMLERQLSYNTEMWEKQNEYNHPLAVAKRLKEAKMNPLMALSGNAGGVAANALGITPPQASSVAPMQAFRPDTSAIQQSAEMFYNKRLNEAQAAKTEAEIENTNIDNMTKLNRDIAAINKLIAETKDIGVRQSLERQRFLLEQRQMNADYNIKLQQERQMALQSEGIFIDNIMKGIQAVNLPTIMKLDIAQKVADVALTKSRTGLTNSQRRLTDNQHTTEGYRQAAIMQDIIESTAREYNIHLDNKTKERLQNSLIETAESDANWRDWNNFSRGLSDIGNAAGNLVNPKKVNSTHYHGGHYTTINR